MTGRLRIGLLGGGSGSMIGPVHRAAIRMTDEYDIIAGVFSSNYEKSLRFAESVGIPKENVYKNHNEMARDAKKLELDAVAILTPNHLHVESAQAFVDQGVHVICEKPLSSSWEGVDKLSKSIQDNNVTFALTHTYSGYPVIRKARDIIASGQLGQIKMVAVEYLQGWLSELMEKDPANSGAVWREDPTQGGSGGVLGDIGTHAFQMAEFVSGLKVESLLSDVTSIPGRAVPDDAKLLLKLSNGATGSLWCSQVAVGFLNGLNLRIFGEKGSLTWSHTSHEELHVYGADNTETVYHKGLNGDGTLPPGHPEGYYEAFSELYKDFASLIKSNGKPEGTSALPGIETGRRGLQFINATLESSQKGGVWVKLS